MESIAVAAGVAVGTLYNHFETREALFAELLAVRRIGRRGMRTPAMRRRLSGRAERGRASALRRRSGMSLRVKPSTTAGAGGVKGRARFGAAVVSDVSEEAAARSA